MRMRRRERGFSMIETVVVISIALVLMGMAVPQLVRGLKRARVESGFQSVRQEVMKARGLAMQGRTIYVVTFDDASTLHNVQLSRVTPGSATPDAPFETLPLPAGFQFVAMPGIPTSTSSVPDGYGSGTTAIDMDLANATPGYKYIYFYPDGSAHDASGRFSGGVLYLANPTDLMTSRALSLIGYTGRVGAWRLAGAPGNTMWKED